MSAVSIRVELPAFSYSFQIQADAGWSIKDVKAEIQRTCTGTPRANGQRLIWRGRFLKDEESVKEIWKSPSDARIVHLSVHPSAWIGIPPTQERPSSSSVSQTVQQVQTPVPPPFQPTSSQATAPRAQLQPQPMMTPPAPLPLEFIRNKHNTATHVLTYGHLPTWQSHMVPRANPATRAHAQNVLQMYGYSWPFTLDEEYPPSTDTDQGVRYEQVVVNNQPFLQLATPNATPNPIQMHALKVLSCTSPLLHLTAPDPTIYQPMPQFNQLPTANLNQHLHQLGFPGLRAVPGQNVNQNPADPNVVAFEVRAIPLRALMVPLMMLLFRTFLLVYFFSPSKRPIFGLILSAWIFYEAWGALRGVLGGDRPNNANAEGQQGQAGNGAAQPPPVAGDPAANGGDNNINVNVTRNRQAANQSLSDQLIDIVGTSRIEEEERELDGGSRSTPGPFAKARLFTTLFVSTLHPAVWDRRRDALRKREGRLRTEANVRESEIDESTTEERLRSREEVTARHQRRAGWVQQYVERVLRTEYVDDA
ncbi:hypothetical protein BDY19DRAFT_566084 [Irpex rosettiformis]|uniref:Uncharacterized protein n=1 Tax=Irpex rosettiformis TaxID=378272 RepID=A0ACB8UC68_9APHY|nr:hypothetical protein BDY19DRAFT_566084 [Irpex rosettiformis]